MLIHNNESHKNNIINSQWKADFFMVWKQKCKILISYQLRFRTNFLRQQKQFAIYQQRYITTITVTHILQSIRFIDHACRYLGILDIGILGTLDILTGQISCFKPGIHNLDENGQCRNQLYAVVYIPGLDIHGTRIQRYRPTISGFT